MARLIVVTLLLLVVVGCASASGASAEPVATDQVDMPPSYRFAPEIITIKAGTTVTWHNSDHFTHSVRLLGGSELEKDAKPGQSVRITFDEPGEYEYDCGYHPHDMHGKVIVTE